MQWNPRRSLRHWFGCGPLLLLGLVTTAGCADEPKNGAQSESAQSVAAYDIATDLWLRRQQPRRAMEQALQAVELDEDNAEAHHLVALIYLDFCRRDEAECRLSEALEHANTAVTLREDFREARNTLGVVLIHAKRYPSAIAALKPLTQDILYQTPENAWGNLGWAYLEAGQLDLAVEALLRSTAVQPNFCVGHFRLGEAYSKKKEVRAALEAYTRALDVNIPICRAMQVAYPARAKVLLQLGRQDEAVSDLEECVHLDKNTDSGRQCSALLTKLQHEAPSQTKDR